MNQQQFHAHCDRVMAPLVADIVAPFADKRGNIDHAGLSSFLVHMLATIGTATVKPERLDDWLDAVSRNVRLTCALDLEAEAKRNRD